ncbi:MAG: hypothetical protein Q3965_05250 [Rothia sp. (in: high G+C Gram-positive bacteria)]|nr:hypothetical protein [Rothia sp. (in: high G+C Gram-positive bacteria)]
MEVGTAGQLATHIQRETDRRHGETPLLVAVDGRSGAGKTGLTNTLLELLARAEVPAAAFRLDDMYQGWRGLLPAVESWQQMSHRIVSGQDAGGWLGWDWATNAPTSPYPFPALPLGGVLLVEGVGALCGSHDIGVWVQLPDVERKQRALARDGQTYIPYWDTWAKQEEELFQRVRQV